MSLLTLIQSVATELNINSPSAVVGNTNKQIIQLLRLANNEGKQLATRYRWQVLKNESTFSSVATESQGAMTTLAGTDFGWIANDTVWNRTSNRRMYPVDDVQWQQMKSSGITGPLEYFRIRGGNFIVIPTMTASQTVAFEWVSKNWCQSSGGTAQSAWAADTDTGKLDEDIMASGVLWRWKKAKGLDYAEDFQTYERLVADAAVRDGAKKHIYMGGGNGAQFLNRNSVNQGNWTL
jgi:hypothetical protein